MPKIIKADFDGSVVTLNSDGWINATVIADANGKRVGDWVDLPSTREYMAELELAIKSPIRTSSKGRQGCTMLHPLLAIEFFGWVGGAKAKAKFALLLQDSRAIIDAMQDFEVPEDLVDMYVYAIRETESGRVKLGISRDPIKRLKTMQTGNSQELELVAYRKANNKYNDEKALHDRHKDKRVRGEWFEGDVNVFIGDMA